MEECRYASVMCPKRCGAELGKPTIRQHLLEECPKREIKCDFCDIPILYEQEESHLQVCGRFMIPCPNECKKGEIPREEVWVGFKYYHIHRETICNLKKNNHNNTHSPFLTNRWYHVNCAHVQYHDNEMEMLCSPFLVWGKYVLVSVDARALGEQMPTAASSVSVPWGWVWLYGKCIYTNKLHVHCICL